MLSRKPLFLIAIVVALLAPPALAQGPEAVSAPVYPGPDGSPHYLLGVSARGSLTDLETLSAAATGNGFQVARDLDANGRISLVIGFKGANAALVDAFLKRAGAGEFGKFTFESTMAPVAGTAKP